MSDDLQQPGEDEPVAVVTMKSESGKYGLMMDARKKVIQAFPDAVDAIRYFEEGYRRGHDLGAGYSTGACLHWAFFDPRVHTLTLRELRNMITLPATVVTRQTVAGWETLMLLDDGEAFHDKGKRPQLV